MKIYRRSELSHHAKTISERLLYQFLPYLYPNTGRITTSNPPPQLKVPPTGNQLAQLSKRDSRLNPTRLLFTALNSKKLKLGLGWNIVPAAEQRTRSGRPNSSVLFVVYAREECITVTRQRAVGWSRGFSSKPSGITNKK